MKPRPRLPRPPMSIDHDSPSSSSPSSLVSTLEYQRKQAYLEAAVAAQQQQQQLQHFSQQQNKQIKAVQKSIMSHQRSHDRGINNHFINNNSTINNNTLAKHQQLQQLLKNNNDNIGGNQNHNLSATKSSQFALACKNWPQGAVSTSQPSPSMPTSLLNLAACSSSNQSQSPNPRSSSSTRSRNTTQCRVSSNSSAPTGNMPATRSSSLIKNNNNIPRSRNQSSLLQDDLSRPSRLNNASNISVLHKPIVKQAQAPTNQTGPRRMSSRSNVKSDLNQGHLGSQSVTIELVSSSHSSDDKLSTTNVDHQEKEIESLALSRTTDDSILQPSISLGNKSRKHVNAYASGMLSDSDQLTNEVKSLVLEECNIIYECKSCSNLFRSLPNFIKHKRSFCPMRSIVTEEGAAKGRSSASLLSDSSLRVRVEDKRTGLASDERDISFSLEPNSAIVDFRPLDYENGDVVTHTYNSRGSGKRYNLTHELRMMRLLQNHDRKAQQQREAARQKEQSLNNNEVIPVETSLSKLLQSQPKARLPASQDKALIEALTIATATSPPVSSNDQRNSSYGMSNLKDGPRPLSRKASSILSTKSLISVEQDNAVMKRNSSDLNEFLGDKHTREPQNLTKKIAPKRKFLEDCIQKVKRDKKLVEANDLPLKVQLTSISSNSNAVLQTTSIDSHSELADTSVERNNVPMSIPDIHLKAESSNNSHLDTDSDDNLTIDLLRVDETKKKSQPTKNRRRSTNSSNPKVSSSSALLKALTRPVLEHNQIIRDISTISSATNLTSQDISKTTKESTHMDGEDISSWISQVDIKPTCDICNIDFEDSLSLIQHNEVKHLIEKLVYPCILCSMSFTLLENACRHIIEIHNKSKDQVIRLKEVVKSRSHLTTDFSTCEDYVPSKASASSSSEDIGSLILPTNKMDELIEPTSSIKHHTSASEQLFMQDAIIPESIDESKAYSVEEVSKEVNIGIIVNDIVTQVVDDHPLECANSAGDLSIEESLDVVRDHFNKTEESAKLGLPSKPDHKGSSEHIPSHSENYDADQLDSKIEANSDSEAHLNSNLDHSEDSKHSQNDQSIDTQAISETHSTNDAPCASLASSEGLLENKDSTNANDSSFWDKECTESSNDEIFTSDCPYVSGDETNKTEHRYTEVHRQDKRDSRSSHNHHESSSRKHHSKDETKHSKSHDKNKSRSRSSSTEHVRSEERAHHKSSYSHHISSAKKKHQSKGEPKTSPVPSGEPLMKLKIQLKTRPDEKCKVYEIV